jgi:hypothetical protein
MVSKKLLAFVGVAALGLGSAAIQAQQGTQAGASSQTNANAQANKQGVQTSGSNSTSASAQTGGNSATLDSGTQMNAVLSHPVDAKKNKPGDQVTAKTTDNVKSNGQVVIPKGSTLVGHVTQTQARGDGHSDSSMGIVFDRAELKNGQSLPINNFAIQAIAQAEGSASTMTSTGPDMMGGSGSGSGMGSGRMSGGGSGSGGGGLLGGATSSVGTTVGTATNATSSAGGVAGNTTSTVNAAGNATGRVAGGATGSLTSNTTGAVGGTVGGLNSRGQLMSNSQGVFGLQGLGLQAAGSSATQAQGSVITSSTRNVHLDSGTQLLLAAQGQAGH